MGQEPAPLNPTEADDRYARHTDPSTYDAAGAREAAAARSDDPQDIRRDIAGTRADMEDTLAAINDRVNPQRVYERRTGRARQRWETLKDSVMGSDDRRWDDAGSRSSGGSRSLDERTPDVDVSGRARQAREAVGDAPDAARRRTRGNPLAAGMIAFGIGALIGGALPESEAEREAARRADEHLDLRSTAQRLTDRAQDVGDSVQEQARDAAQDLRGSTQDAARDVAEDAKAEGQRVKDDAQHSADRVRDER